MTQRLKKYQVTVPAEYAGQAIGHLSGVGGWIDGMDEPNTDTRVLFVRLPIQVDPAAVKAVLARIVQGQVLIVGGEAANDEDV